MLKKFKKVIITIITVMITLGSVNQSVYAVTDTDELEVGEVTQNKSAQWSDYEKGIAKITFDVVGKNAEEPLDVAIVYDNSGSMQNATNSFAEYTTSRWYYASSAATLFAKELLKNKDSAVAFIPFSDVLIDGTTIHQNPTDFFETHELLYDANGNPDIVKMSYIHQLYGQVEKGRMTMDEFYQWCQQYYNISKEQLVEKNNVKNAVIPFSHDEDEITSAIDGLYPAFVGQTNYEIALSKAKELFSANDSNSKKVIVMISDGKPNVGGDSTVIANQLKESGVTIYTCGIAISDNNATTLKNIASKENGVPLYTSCEPDDLASTFKLIRKQLSVAATDAVIEDMINTEYFEYYTDETHKPTMNDREATEEEFIVAQDKGSVTWKIGDINETKKTLSFYVKVKDSLLNEEALNKDDSLLNKAGVYATNGEANLSYKEVNTDRIITTGHEMESPVLDVGTATLETIYYASDMDGNIIDNTILNQKKSTKKALHINYALAPEVTIVKDGITYYILEEDNHQITKKFTQKEQHETVTYRYVQQMHVKFDTNGAGQFDDDMTLKNINVNHQTMTVPQIPEIEDIPANRYFIGWNIQKDGNGQPFDNTTIIRENMTVYAQYAYYPVTVTFQNEDGYVYKEQSVEYGGDATAPDQQLVIKEGYTLTGWDKGFTNVKEHLVVTTQFDANKYTVIFDDNAATSGQMDKQTVTYDKETALNKNAYQKDNYTFIGWLYNGKVYSDEEKIKNLVSNANENITFVAQWQENDQFTVIFQDDEGNVLKTESVYQGKDAIAPAAPTKEGYTWIGWDVAFTNVNNDLVVTAVYRVNPPIILPEEPIAPENPIAPIGPIITPTPIAAIPGAVIPAPVVTLPVVNTPVEQQVQEEQQEQTILDQVENEEIIEEQEIPLGSIESSWALVNLICTVLTILAGIFLIVSKNKKEEEEQTETTQYKRRVWTKIAGIVVAVVSVIAFILTEDITLPIQYVDKWTIVMIALTVVQVIVILIGRKWKDETIQEESKIA